MCTKLFLRGCKIARLDWGVGSHMHIRSFQADVLFVTYHVEWQDSTHKLLLIDSAVVGTR